jgi:ribokinase
MIIVFGSINMDVNMRVPHFLRPGETLLAPTYDMSPGGKGANQSMAASKSGARTALVGSVGDDGMGNRILANLRRHEVMTSGVAASEDLPTGMAFVIQADGGENQIIVASGANQAVNDDQVPDEILKEGNLVLCQMELPVPETIKVLERAKSLGATTLLNLAPAGPFPESALASVDYLILNEIEAEMLANEYGIDRKQDLKKLAQEFARRGDLICIVTIGSQGAFAVNASGQGWKVSALRLEKVIDTTGAGDCFCGTFAAALHEKIPLNEALRRASVAASLSCLELGAQDSYPYLGDIEDALNDFPAAEKL